MTQALIDKKILKAGNIITASVTAFGFCDTPYFTKKDGIILEITPEYIKVKYSDQKTRKTKYEELEYIEGMDIERFAQAYKIKPKKINKKQ